MVFNAFEFRIKLNRCLIINYMVSKCDAISIDKEESEWELSYHNYKQQK